MDQLSLSKHTQEAQQRTLHDPVTLNVAQDARKLPVSIVEEDSGLDIYTGSVSFVLTTNFCSFVVDWNVSKYQREYLGAERTFEPKLRDGLNNIVEYIEKVPDAWKLRAKYELAIGWFRICQELEDFLYYPEVAINPTNRAMANELIYHYGGRETGHYLLNNIYIDVPLRPIKRLRQFSFNRAEVLARRMQHYL